MLAWDTPTTTCISLVVKAGKVRSPEARERANGWELFLKAKTLPR